MTGYLLPIHQQLANYIIEEWSMRSLASSVQNHTGYIKNFLMSQYCKSPPSSHIITEVSTPSPLRGWHYLLMIHKVNMPTTKTVLMCVCVCVYIYIYKITFTYYYLDMYVVSLVTTYLVTVFNGNLIII